MDVPHKPDGYSSVSPHLVVDGADATIAFLERMFGAIALRRFAAEGSGVMHAEVRLDDSVIKDDEDRRGGVRDAGGTT